MSAEGLVGRLPQTVSRQVERDGQVLVLLDCGFEPLFTVSGKLVVGQERYGEGDVGLGRAEIATILEGLVDGMECSAASRLLQVGCHSSDGVDLQVCVLAAAQLFGCFKGCSSVFGEVAEKGKGVQSSGCKKMWFVDGMLPSAKLAEKSLVGG